jgi:hypothetical protein
MSYERVAGSLAATWGNVNYLLCAVPVVGVFLRVEHVGLNYRLDSEYAKAIFLHLIM